MPDERYRLTIGGIRGTEARISLYDPLSDSRLAVRVRRRGSSSLTVEVPLTDSVRLLEIRD